ncbi:MAG: TonB-dependent receptor [Proteobacteria bacterium]|nr:TonB-dependent receptor [Pseudomonadota bacterium]
MKKTFKLQSAIAALTAMGTVTANTVAFAQDTENSGRQLSALEEIVVTGTRVANRTNLDTTSPVDVITSESLGQSGTTELNQALSLAVPSYNFPRPGLADGTDTIRPATLRGLSPDQALVLVNSKRRHSASLVNVNGTVGRGSSAVDLNTIPIGIVDRIEVLRDGAAAQYGSDAIAGVINLRLRETREGGEITASYSANDTKVKTNTRVSIVPGATWPQPESTSRNESDGDTVTLSGWKGFGLGDSGFLTVAAEYKDANRTERGAFDVRQQYPLVDGNFDPREQTINRFNHWYGDPELEQLSFFANMGYDIAPDVALYGWASYQDREAVSAGFYRRALDARNVIEVHPDGFLPKIAPEVEDMSLAGGITWKSGEWDMDASMVYGYNSMDFTIKNTGNRSIGATSKTVFDAGGFDASQLTLNLSGVRGYNVGLASPLNVALGVEARRDNYSISAGEPDSYRNGGVLLPNGKPTPSGSQVFPGFQPSNEVDEDRSAVGAYLDMEVEVTSQLLLSTALRVEDYSDFGSAIAGKFSARYDFTEAFAIRGTLQNGFRAPSLQQQFFTATSTNFIDGVPFDITTFPATNEIAAALGAQELEAEESINISAGFVLRAGDLSLTMDAYRIEIDDRIVLSENLTQKNVREFLTDAGFIGIGGGRFFINGVETVTEGIDMVLNVPIPTDKLGYFDLTVGANYNTTDIKKVPVTDELATLNPSPTLFARVNVLTFEEGTPEDKYTVNLNWSLDRMGANVRAVRYGDVLSPSSNPANDLILKAAWVMDLEGRFDFNQSLRFALGVNNLFDEYPTRSPGALNGTGATPYSNLSPFGRNGRSFYGRITYNF